VKVTEHAPELRVHVETEKLPATSADHATVPVGELPETVAVHVVEPVMEKETGEQEIPVLEPWTAKLLGARYKVIESKISAASWRTIRGFFFF
jgi:hypothetical protein